MGRALMVTTQQDASSRPEKHMPCEASVSHWLAFRTDNAVKNRWAALCKKDPQLERDHVLSTATTSATKGARLQYLHARRRLWVLQGLAPLESCHAGADSTPSVISHHS